MPADFQRVLILAPHTDDGEIGCGASIGKWVCQGKEVYYVVFSSASKSLPKGMPANTLEKEVRQAMRVLGIARGNLILFKYLVREFPSHRQQILEDMTQLKEKLKPDLVLLPSTNDTHQDHQIVSHEGFRAFKRISIIGYEMPYNNLSFNTGLFVTLDEADVTRKIGALRCYKSQAQKPYVTPDFVRSLATVRGAQIGVRYAEAFEVIRWVIH